MKVLISLLNWIPFSPKIYLYTKQISELTTPQPISYIMFVDFNFQINEEKIFYILGN